MANIKKIGAAHGISSRGKLYNMSGMLSESYRALFECEKGTRLYQLVEAHIQSLQQHPTALSTHSQNLHIIKELLLKEESELDIKLSDLRGEDPELEDLVDDEEEKVAEEAPEEEQEEVEETPEVEPEEESEEAPSEEPAESEEEVSSEEPADEVEAEEEPAEEQEMEESEEEESLEETLTHFLTKDKGSIAVRIIKNKYVLHQWDYKKGWVPFTEVSSKEEIEEYIDAQYKLNIEQMKKLADLEVITESSEPDETSEDEELTAEELEELARHLKEMRKARKMKESEEEPAKEVEESEDSEEPAKEVEESEEETEQSGEEISEEEEPEKELEEARHAIHLSVGIDSDSLPKHFYDEEIDELSLNGIEISPKNEDVVTPWDADIAIKNGKLIMTGLVAPAGGMPGTCVVTVPLDRVSRLWDFSITPIDEEAEDELRQAFKDYGWLEPLKDSEEIEVDEPTEEVEESEEEDDEEIAEECDSKKMRESKKNFLKKVMSR